jgi:hypothetical protein
MRDSRLLWLCLLFGVGCADNPPPKAQSPGKQINPQLVRVTKAEPPTGCTMLGSVTAGMAFSYENAIDSLRIKTAELGGDWLTLDYPTAGRAFWCPPAVVDAYDAARSVTAPAAPPPAAPATSPAYSLLCEPECSPGYTCVRGQCVEACNPRCVAPQRCGVDRLCK